MAQLTRTQFSTENRVRGHLGSGKAPPCGCLGGGWARGAGGQDDLPHASESLGVLGPGTKGIWGACQWLSGYLGARLQHIMGPFLGLENFSGPSLTLICSLIFPFLHVSFNKWVLWTSHPPGLWLQTLPTH